MQKIDFFEDGLKSHSKSRKPGGFWESFRTVAYAILIAVGVRTFAYEPFNIPSGSMYPTVLVGDYLFVSKLSYGYSRYSLPYSIPLFSGRIFSSEPERGDVVVFRHPREPDVNYIKRLIGLPGDRIQAIDGILHVNGEAVQRRRIDDFVSVDQDSGTRGIPQFIVTLPGGREHRSLEESDDKPFDNTPVYEVPAGHYFMMGDNRDNSIDSRVEMSAGVGMVPAENLVGKAEIIMFSWTPGASLFNPVSWFANVRFSRFFKILD